MRLLRATRRSAWITVCVFTSLALGLSTSPALADEGDDPGGASRPILGIGPDGTEDDGEIGLVGGMATGPDGTVYVADIQRDRVYAVDASGEMSTFAGTGDEEDDAGDGAPATEAHLDTPKGLTVTDDGTVYVGIPRESSIRAIAPDGTISTPFTDEEEWDIVTTVHLGTDGTDLYAAVEGRGILHVTSDGEDEEIVEESAVPGVIEGMDVAEDGTVYLATRDQVHAVNDGDVEEALPDWWADGDLGEGDEAPPSALGVAVDDEALLIAGRNGLFRHENGQITAIPSPPMGPIALDPDTGSLYFHEQDDPAAVWRFTDPGSDAPEFDMSGTEPGSATTVSRPDRGIVERNSVSVDRGDASDGNDLAVGGNGELYVAGSEGYLWSEDDDRLPLPGPSYDVTSLVPGDSGLFFLSNDRPFEYSPDGSITALSDTMVRHLAGGNDTLAVAEGLEISLLEEDGTLTSYADLSDASPDRHDHISDLDSSRRGEFVAVHGGDGNVTHVRSGGELDTVATLADHFEEFTPTSVAAASDGTVFVGGSFDENPEYDVPEDASMEFGGAILRVTPDGDMGTIAMLSGDDAQSPPAPALDVRFEEPHGLALDSDGHLHFLDDRDSYVLFSALDAPLLESKPLSPSNSASPSGTSPSSGSVMIAMSALALAAAAGVLRWIHVRGRPDDAANAS